MNDNPVLLRTKEYTLTPQEFFRVNIQMAFNWKPARRITGIIIASIVIGASIWYLFGEDRQSLVFGGLTTIYIIFAYVIRYFLIIRREARAPEDKYVFAQGGYFEFDRDFVWCHSNDGSLTKLRLDRIYRVIKASDHYLLMSYARRFALMHRAFQSEADMKQFEDLFHDVMINIGTVNSAWDIVEIEETPQGDSQYPI